MGRFDAKYTHMGKFAIFVGDKKLAFFWYTYFLNIDKIPFFAVKKGVFDEDFFFVYQSKWIECKPEALKRHHAGWHEHNKTKWIHLFE